MTRSNMVIGGIVVIILIIAGIVVFGGNKNSGTSNSQTQSTASTSSTNQPTAAATISYTGSVFTPSQITVKAGDSVLIKNDSQTDVDVESNPHPIHTDNTDFNLGLIGPGQSKTFSTNKTGSWSYHNHLNPSQGGTVVVK